MLNPTNSFALSYGQTQRMKAIVPLQVLDASQIALLQKSVTLSLPVRKYVERLYYTDYIEIADQFSTVLSNGSVNELVNRIVYLSTTTNHDQLTRALAELSGEIAALSPTPSTLSDLHPLIRALINGQDSYSHSKRESLFCTKVPGLQQYRIVGLYQILAVLLGSRGLTIKCGLLSDLRIFLALMLKPDASNPGPFALVEFTNETSVVIATSLVYFRKIDSDYELATIYDERLAAYHSFQLIGPTGFSSVICNLLARDVYINKRPAYYEQCSEGLYQKAEHISPGFRADRIRFAQMPAYNLALDKVKELIALWIQSSQLQKVPGDTGLVDTLPSPFIQPSPDTAITEVAAEKRLEEIDDGQHKGGKTRAILRALAKAPGDHASSLHKINYFALFHVEKKNAEHTVGLFIKRAENYGRTIALVGNKHISMEKIKEIESRLTALESQMNTAYESSLIHSTALCEAAQGSGDPELVSEAALLESQTLSTIKGIKFHKDKQVGFAHARMLKNQTDFFKQFLTGSLSRIVSTKEWHIYHASLEGARAFTWNYYYDFCDELKKDEDNNELQSFVQELQLLIYQTGSDGSTLKDFVLNEILAKESVRYINQLKKLSLRKTTTRTVQDLDYYEERFSTACGITSWFMETVLPIIVSSWTEASELGEDVLMKLTAVQNEAGTLKTNLNFQPTPVHNRPRMPDAILDKRINDAMQKLGTDHCFSLYGTGALETGTFTRDLSDLVHNTTERMLYKLDTQQGGILHTLTFRAKELLATRPTAVASVKAAGVSPDSFDSFVLAELLDMTKRLDDIKKTDRLVFIVRPGNTAAQSQHQAYFELVNLCCNGIFSNESLYIVLTPRDSRILRGLQHTFASYFEHIHSIWTRAFAGALTKKGRGREIMRFTYAYAKGLVYTLGESMGYGPVVNAGLIKIIEGTITAEDMLTIGLAMMGKGKQKKG